MRCGRSTNIASRLESAMTACRTDSAMREDEMRDDLRGYDGKSDGENQLRRQTQFVLPRAESGFAAEPASFLDDGHRCRAADACVLNEA